VGDRIRIGSEEYFTVVQVDPAVSGTTLLKPAAGHKWVAVLAQIEGIDPTGATYNAWYFKVRDQDGFEYTSILFGKDPQLQASNDLKPGAKVQGWVTFEVPVTATTLTLIYDPFVDPVEVALI
jgi:hypothetical protein